MTPLMTEQNEATSTDDYGDIHLVCARFLVGDTKQQGRMYYPLPFSFHQTQGYYRFVVVVVVVVAFSVNGW